MKASASMASRYKRMYREAWSTLERGKSLKEFSEFNKYGNLSNSIEFWTFQNNLDLNLCVVFFTSCMVTISEKDLGRWNRNRSKYVAIDIGV